MSAPQSLELPVGDLWVQGWLTGPTSPRAGILLVPPLFHEWQRGYRLFALLADALAARGVAMLRFDYRGCGDSGGDDAQFLPSRAAEDASLALHSLAARTTGPIAVLAVRAGALIADRMQRTAAVRLWRWQPVHDGAAYLDALARRHAQECNNRVRFPFLLRAREPDPGVLMGYRVHAGLAGELGAMRLAAGAATLCIDAAAAAPDVILPPELSRWVDEVDFSGVFPAPMVRTLAERLGAELDR